MNNARALPEISIEGYQVSALFGGAWTGPAEGVQFSGAACDSRQVKPGNLFVALRGERTDGHLYLAEAVLRGAAVLMVERNHPAVKTASFQVPLLEVADTHKGLFDLAAWYRSRFDVPMVAITGSNGKTTTKEMIAAVLASRFDTFKTPGNLNSGIGVPLALFSLSSRHQVAVCELGMSSHGEIDRLGALVKPRCAVFTNIAPVHLQSLHTVEEVAQAKFELLAHLGPDGVAVFNADDPLLSRKAAELGAQSRTYGIDAEAGLRGFDIRMARDGVRFRMESGLDVALPLFGRHNVYNALAALSVGQLFGVDELAAVSALATMEPAEHRSRILEQGALTIIDDAYNANPRATISALESFAEYPARARRVAVLGDMLELGAREREWHLEVGHAAAESDLDLLICVGTLSAALAEGALTSGLPASRLQTYRTSQECAGLVSAWCKSDDTVLLKGSRGAALERVLSAMLNYFPELPKEDS